MEEQKIKPLILHESDFQELSNLFSSLIEDRIIVYSGGSNEVILEGETNSSNKLNVKSGLYASFEEEKAYRSLIIQVISVATPQRGIGSKLFEWLKGFAVTKGFQRIEIQNCHTDDSQIFSEKMGMMRKKNTGFVLEAFGESDDFIIEI